MSDSNVIPVASVRKGRQRGWLEDADFFESDNAAPVEDVLSELDYALAARKKDLADSTYSNRIMHWSIIWIGSRSCRTRS